MDIIQKIKNWFFGKEEIIETPIVEKLTKEELKEVIKTQEEKPKRKYNRKKSTSETK